jgi:tRNA CCA-adding enzyme
LELFLLPEIRRKILREITPSEDECKKQREIIKEITNALTEKGEALGQEYSFIQAHGSTGQKQTQLRGASDIDIFVGLAPVEYQMILNLSSGERFNAIDQLMESLIEQWFMPSISELDYTNVVKSFSQHPYLNLRIRGLDVDILSCFDLDNQTLMKEGPITAVDRTVHHTRYVVERLTEKMREDVRLLKSFVRACHAYGDKCAVGRMGFTGYSLELLIIECMNFEQALDSLYNLDQAPIDPLKRSLNELRKIEAFRDDMIFIIDPIDHNRNVASSFSTRSYKWVRLQIEHLRNSIEEQDWNRVVEILKESSIPIDPVPEQIRKHMLVYEFFSDESVHYTILRDKLHRLAKKISRALENERTGEIRFGKSLFEVVFHEQNYALGFLIEHSQIQDFFIRKGPPTNLHQAVSQFKKEHPDAFEKDGFVWAEKQRKWKKPDTLIKSMLSQNPIKGLHLQDKDTKISEMVLNTIYQYILPVEIEFPLSAKQEFKDNG